MKEKVKSMIIKDNQNTNDYYLVQEFFEDNRITKSTYCFKIDKTIVNKTLLNLDAVSKEFYCERVIDYLNE